MPSRVRFTLESDRLGIYVVAAVDIDVGHTKKFTHFHYFDRSEREEAEDLIERIKKQDPTLRYFKGSQYWTEKGRWRQGTSYHEKRESDLPINGMEPTCY